MSKTEAKAINPYLAAREEWNERYNDIIVGAKNWRLAALVFAVVALVAVFGMIAEGSRQKVIPFVVEVDKAGNVVGEGTAKPDQSTNDTYIRAALWSWVRDWRMVSSDKQVEKEAIGRVYALIGDRSPAAMHISNSYREASPLKLAESETVTVDVNSVYAASKTSYEIEWTETTFDVNGVQVSSQRYKGVITIQLNPPKDENVAHVNPLGVYVTDISWSKVL